MKEIELKNIKDPLFLKEMNIEELEKLVGKIRKHIIESCATYGGHLSSNLGLVELEVSLYKFFDAPKDKIFFDVGHQCYTEKILTGRPLLNLRKKDGNDGFLNLSESIYDTYEAGHSSTSISYALGEAYFRDFNNENFKIISVIGDASISNGIAFEAINNLVNYNKQFLIILNDNEMGIANTTGGLSSFLKENKKSFKSFNLEYVGPVDGNNIKDLLGTFEKIKDIDHPVLLHVKTKKGKGYLFSEEDKVGKYHFINKFDIKTGETFINNEFISFSNLYSNLLDKQMEKDKNIVVITPATSMGANLTTLFKKYPNRCFDVGINEEHALLFANGLALDKVMHPYVVIYSTFLQRAFDEVIHDISRLNLKVTILVDKIGLIGEDGISHQGIYDLSFLMNVPNLTITSPSNEEEAKELFKFSLSFNRPLIIRYPFSLFKKSNDLDLENVKNLNFQDFKIVLDSNKKKEVVVSYGPHLEELKEEIIDNKFDLTLINLIFLNPISEKLIDFIVNFEEIVIYDPYATVGALSMQLLYILNKKSYIGKVKIFSIDTKYVDKASVKEQEIENKVDVKTIIDYLKEHK